MEIKQETSEKTFKIEIDNETSVHPLNTFKIEIKEEPKRECSYQEFNYLDFKEFPVKTKAEQEQDEYKLTLLDEKQTTNEEKRKPIKELKELPIGKPFPMHSAKVVNGQFGETVLLDLGPEGVFLPPRVTEVYRPAINTLCGEKYCLIFEGEVDVRKARPLLSFRITENELSETRIGMNTPTLTTLAVRKICDTIISAADFMEQSPLPWKLTKMIVKKFP